MDLSSITAEQYEALLERLRALSDSKYKEFNSKIVPDMGESLGVRSPEIKKAAKGLMKNPDLPNIVKRLHEGSLYEEKQLEGALIPYLHFDGTEQMLEEIRRYIGRINNWALCDGFVVAVRPLVKKNRELFYEQAKKYTYSDNPWEIRFGLILMNGYFNTSEYMDEIFPLLERIKSGHYYVKMGIAWLVSTLYVHDNARVYGFLKNTSLDNWCVNKSIQKTIESYRVSDEEKKAVRELKRK